MSKTTKIILLTCFLACLLLTMRHAHAFDHARLAKTSYEKHILPGYQALATEAGKLQKTMSKFCQAPHREGLEQVRNTFKSTLLAWSRIEHIRFGPVVKNYRYERFAYWPDHKGRGLRQVRRILGTLDQSVLSAEKLPRKSIALQGLTALEFLLYGTDYKVLLDKGEDGHFRCNFAKAISLNLKTMSDEITMAWSREAEYTKAFLNPGENKTYLKPAETTLALFQAYVTGYAKSRRLKILGPLGGWRNGKIKPRKAAYWRSHMSVDVLMANLEGLSEMFLKGGFSELTSKEAPKLKRSVVITKNNGLRIMQRINGPISDILNDEKRHAKFRFIATIFSVLRAQTGRVIIKASGLTIGFNAEDGD